MKTEVKVKIVMLIVARTAQRLKYYLKKKIGIFLPLAKDHVELGRDPQCADHETC